MVAALGIESHEESPKDRGVFCLEKRLGSMIIVFKYVKDLDDNMAICIMSSDYFLSSDFLASNSMSRNLAEGSNPKCRQSLLYKNIHFCIIYNNQELEIT